MGSLDAVNELKLLLRSRHGLIWLESLDEKRVGTLLKLIADQLNSMSNSAGNLFLKGKVTEHNVMLSSAGNLSAFELLADTTTIILNSAGSAQVYASKLLDVTINSVGSVFYKGDPVIIQHLNSIGRVYSAN